MKNKILPLLILAAALIGAVTIVWGSDSTMLLNALTNPPPRRPILNFPAPNATSSYTGSTFQMTATHPIGNYLQYKQEIYYNEACTQVVQSNDQTANQSGWFLMNASSVPYTSYIAGNATGTTGLYLLQTNLASGTSYYWGAQAYDPDGSVSWGSSTLTRVDNSWTDTQALPAAVDSHSSVTYNGYVYVIGGEDASGNATSTVLYARINANSSLGQWTNTTALPAGTYNFSSVVYNGYVYESGGIMAGSNITSTVRYAQIQSNGTLGSWTNTTALPTSTFQHSSVAYNGYVYVIGGFTVSGVSPVATSTVRYTSSTISGTLNSWKTTTALPSSTYAHSSVAYNGYVYVIGGVNSGGVLTSTVRYAPINATGSLGSWTDTQSLPSSTYFHSSVVYNGYVYESGGIMAGAKITSTVRYAPINATGSLGSWTNTTALPTSTAYHSSVVSNGYVYVMGGTAGGSTTSTVRYTQINVQGTTEDGGWVNTTPLPFVDEVNTSFAYNGYAYVLGGYAGTFDTSTVLYGPIQSNGTIANWSSTTKLLFTSERHASFAYNGYAYVLGGFANGGTDTSTVLYGPIQSNGTIANWSSTASLPFTDHAHASFAYNGYAYVVGGCLNTGCSTITSTVVYGQIQSSGTIANWSSTTALPFNDYSHSSFAYNGYAYVLGGTANGAATKTVLYGQIQSSGTIANWSSTTQLPFTETDHSSFVYNGYAYVVGGTANGAATKTVVYAQMQQDGSLSSWLAATQLPFTDYFHSSFAYNGYAYVLGGNANGAITSTVTRIGLYTSCIPFTTPSSTNQAPTVSAVVLNHGSTTITLTPNATTSVDINYTVTDQNGCADIVNMTSTAFRLGVSATCAVPNPTTNNLNCYSFLTHTTSSCVGGNQYNVTDTVDIYYFAQSTGDSSSTYPSDQWEAYATAADFLNVTSSATSSARNVGITTAITVTTSSINYGTMTPTATTTLLNEPNALVQNVGNSSATLMISGTALVMNSPYDKFATSSQHYATSTPFSFGLNEQQLTDTVTTVPGFSVIAPHIDTTPVVQNWANTQSLPYTDYYHSSFAYNGYAYVVGGFTSSGDTANVRYGRIQSNGTIPNWSSTTQLPFTDYQHASFAYNGYAYVVGGYDFLGDTGISNVLYGPIQSSGTIANWSSTTQLPFTETSHSSFVYNGYAYVVGGTADGAATKTVLYGPIQSSGTIANWSSTASLPSADYLHSSFVYNGYAYVVGGAVTSNVLYGPIQSSGTIANWSSAASLPSTDYGHTSFVYNGYAYVVGGCAGGGGNCPTSTVLYASLDARDTYWGVQIPGGAQAGVHTGTITFSSAWAP